MFNHGWFYWVSILGFGIVFGEFLKTIFMALAMSVLL